MPKSASTALFHRKESYRKLVRLLIALHELMRDGQGDTPEADEIRTEMDYYWHELSDEEVVRVEGMSADLYTLEPDSPIVHPDEVTNTDPEFWKSLQDARSEGNYVQVLNLLRSQPHQIDAARASFLRALCYHRLGEPEIATLFYDDALRRQPDDDMQASMALIAFETLGRKDKSAEWAERLAKNPEQRSAGLLGVLANILREESLRDSPTVNERLLRESTDLLMLAIGKLKQENSNQAPVKNLLVSSLVEVAYSCWRLKQSQEANEYLDQALSIQPKDGDAFAMRGLFNRETNPQNALKDFEQAAQHETGFYFPYVILAEHALRNRRFRDSSDYVMQAIKRTTDANELATLYEWLAISNAELGAPEPLVIKLFDYALSLWPGHSTIEFNRNLYRQHLTNKTSASYRLTAHNIPGRFEFTRSQLQPAGGIAVLP